MTMKISGRLLYGIAVISLAFFLLPLTAMGDDTPDVDESDLAYDTINGRFLHVYADSADIFGQFYSSDGSYAGSAFAICDNVESQEAPMVAWASTHQMFLVVWEDRRNGQPDVYGQFVTDAGELHGTASTTNFVICDDEESQQRPSVDYDPAADMFLTAWADRRTNSSNPDIYGQFVTTTDPGYLYSTISTENFIIAANITHGQHSPEVGYDGASGLFLVAFMDYRDAANNIYGQLVDAVNTADFLYSTTADTNFPIGTTFSGKKSPALAYDSVNGRYLVVWDETSDWTQYDIAGQIVDASDTADFLYSTDADENIMVSDFDEIFKYGPRAAYDPENHAFLVAWSDYRGPETVNVYGQILSGSGALMETLSDENFPLVASTEEELDDPVPAFIPGTDSIIVVYNVDDTYWRATVYTIPEEEEEEENGGGNGGGCFSIGNQPTGPAWPGLLGATLLAMMMLCMWRRERIRLSTKTKY
jgi:hypothetical protein